MIRQFAFCASQFCDRIIDAAPPLPELNASAAPGARSCTISSIAVPSSPEPTALIWTPSGRSPDACAVAQLTAPSEMTPTRAPVPSMLNAARAWSARWIASPWVSALPMSAAGMPAMPTSRTHDSSATACTRSHGTHASRKPYAPATCAGSIPMPASSPRCDETFAPSMRR